MVDEIVGPLVFISGDVFNFAVFEFVNQIDSLPEKRPDLLAFDFVLAVNLSYEQFAVAENHQPFGANLSCGFEGFYEGSIFGYVVCGPTEK